MKKLKKSMEQVTIIVLTGSELKGGQIETKWI